MITVKTLREPKPEPIKPRIQCSIKIARPNYLNWRKGYRDELESRVKERGWNLNQCMHDATHIIEGKYYCTNHGGAIALKALTES